MLNPNLNRWIYASVVKHFMLAAEEASIPLYIDRYDRNTSWVELRFIGPSINQLSRSTYLILCSVDLMLTAFVEKDQYLMSRMTGAFAAAYMDICVYKYGDSLEDDHGLVSELKLTPRNNNRINIINFGLIQQDTHMQRSVMSSDYEMLLKDVKSPAFHLPRRQR